MIKKRGKILAVGTIKGGVGKTYASCSFAVEHYQQTGEEVLIVDLDPSVNTTYRVIEDPDAINISLSDIFRDRTTDPSEAVYYCQKNKYPGVSVMASNTDLQYVDSLVASRSNREKILKRSLDKLRDRFGLIIIDCPPSPGLLIENAIVACDGYISPMSMDTDSVDGVMAMRGIVRLLLEEDTIESAPENLKAFWSMFDLPNSHGTKKVLKAAHDQLGDSVLDLMVSKSVHVREATSNDKTLQLDTKHKISIQYQKLLNHVHTGLGIQ